MVCILFDIPLGNNQLPTFIWVPTIINKKLLSQLFIPLLILQQISNKEHIQI